MTIEEIVYAKIIEEQEKINQKSGNVKLYDGLADAQWRLHRMVREDFLTLLSEAIEDRLWAFSIEIDDKIDKAKDEVKEQIRYDSK